MTSRHFSTVRQAGFTLVEAVIVITIIGILGAVVAVFIRMPIQNYQDSLARAELTDIADLALRRMARDLRLALPNSIEVPGGMGSSITFLMTRTGGRYLAAEDGVSSAPVLDFINPDNKTFTMIGRMPSGKQAIQPNVDFVVVNNLGIPGASARDGDNIALITGVTRVSDDQHVISLANNPFAAQSPPMPSPTSRFQVVSGPVGYSCAGGTLLRTWDWSMIPGRASDTAAGQSSALANRVSSCSFSYNQDANRRTGMVILTLELEMPNEGGKVSLVHQVHVGNTP
jgi:MSHA biogenesis protein MshO